MKEKATILFMTRRFYPQIGGVEKHVLKISQELTRMGYKIIILTEAVKKEDLSRWSRSINDDTIIAPELNLKAKKRIHFANNADEMDVTSSPRQSFSEASHDITVHRMPDFRESRLKKFFIWLWLLRNKTIIINSDIIHSHDVFFWYLPFRFIFFRKPVFTTFHGYEKYPIPFKNKMLRKLAEKLSRGNICVGEYLKKWYGTEPNYITYGGVDLKVKKRKVKSENINSKLNVLLIGRLEDDIGVPVYLSALRKLKERGIPFSFEAFGDGSLRNKVEQFGQVHGFIDDISDSIFRADVILASSYLSILESLIQSKPVIAVYTNPLKKDYLYMTPFHQWVNIINIREDMNNIFEQIQINRHKKNKKSEYAAEWAETQTWENVAKIYLRLWSKFNTI